MSETKIIKTVCGHDVIVDADLDLSMTTGKVWLLHGYPSVYIPSGGLRPSLHRLVMSATKGTFVDHINGNKTDCRRENLRFVSLRENRLNSKVRGYTREKTGRPYRVRIGIGRERIDLGRFDTKEDAVAAYKAFYDKQAGSCKPRIIPIT